VPSFARSLSQRAGPSLSRVVQGYRADEQPVRQQERALSLSAGSGGVEVRPTRIFLWVGTRESGRQWIYPLGMEPQLLRTPRRRRHIELGSWQVSFLGNPAWTLVLFAVRLARSRRRGSLPPKRDLG
jgi:hypothetical protein